MTEPSKQMDLMPEADSKTSGAVECLGQTFASDAARRDHYLNRLRAALVELETKLGGVAWTSIDDAVARLGSLEHWQLGDPDRLRELAQRMRDGSFGNGRGKDLLGLWKDEIGFPYGDIENILRLSDPPYYTACPNPFIGAFVAHYGKIYDSLSSDYRREPFAADVSDGKNDPIYNVHSYHTKVPHRAIMRYILHYTEPGDVIFDGFSGTGMAGVAALSCGDELEVQKLGYSIKNGNQVFDEHGDFTGLLGRRSAILNDLSPFASLVTTNYSRLYQLKSFSLEASRIVAKVEKELD